MHTAQSTSTSTTHPTEDDKIHLVAELAGLFVQFFHSLTEVALFVLFAV